jgi:RNA polymerase sigma-70 factor (ECF subfamily)
MARRLGRDERLLRTLYTEHGGPLLGYAERLTGGDRQQAEDVVQETLIRAWRNAERLEAGSARPWLFRVARNIAIDRARARRSRIADAPADVVEAVAGPDDLDSALLAWQIADALRSLSPDHRRVTVEVYYRGRSVAEAADVLGVPRGTVQSRTFYALRALRVALEERGVTGT